MRPTRPSIGAVLGLAVLVAGCVWVPLHKGAETVRVLPLGHDASACRRLGEIAVSVKGGVGSWKRDALEVRDELETLARNEALTLDADSVQPITQPVEARQHWLALRCGPAKAGT